MEIITSVYSPDDYVYGYPASEHEQIVRCKDCKYAEPEVHCGQTLLRCRWFTDVPGYYPRFVEPCGFCAWAKPKWQGEWGSGLEPLSYVSPDMDGVFDG